MKRIKTIYKSIALVALAFASFVFAGCDRLHEDLQPCERGIRLKLYYDYNMKFADAFPSEVRNVSVYVFDPANGSVIDRINIPVGEVREHEFEVNLDHLAPGHYDFLIWCYGESVKHFTVRPNRADEEIRQNYSCLMSEDEGAPGHQHNDIGRLYHGKLYNADCSDEQRIVTFDVPLVKNTNVVRLVLQNLNGKYLPPEKFDITLESDNGHMDPDNMLIAGHNRVYHPWEVRSGTTGMNKFIGDTRAITSVSALVAEHTIGRIVPGNDVRLRVRNTETGKDIIDLPFIDYALLVKGNYNRPMSDLEYLDRQDEYNMVFFLDDKLEWINQYIYINSWRIVLQETDL
ncbi:MAG: FimB/Mfa2 family fimbrial subunit [Muribaculaceae bacterium]|nr:FimB/Mfa2 family fimbrial subunit [Muribaculaceae bacterium]